MEKLAICTNKNSPQSTHSHLTTRREEGMDQRQQTILLSAAQIASWQLPDAYSGAKNCRAALPALQRGAVWKVNQIEALWDSLLRGFPIGAFLLARFSDDRGQGTFAFKKKKDLNLPPPDYHLLDGQQRCNSITLGFLNAWNREDQNVPAALWIDLEPPGKIDGRRFIFRAITRSHPWGYGWQDPGTRLEAKLRREAFEEYKTVNKLEGERGSRRASEIPLSLCWPWDAKAPVPFFLLLEVAASGSSNPWPLLYKKIENNLSYWSNCETIHSRHGDWKKRVGELLNCHGEPAAQEHMDLILRGVNCLLGDNGKSPSVLIPALILPDIVTVDSREETKEEGSDQANAIEQPDPIATLFIRVNSGGTVLTGEELIYSILKSIWPNAQELVESMSTTFMAPSRLVMFLSRLVLARASIEKEWPAIPPVPPDVGRFRRLILGKDPQCKDFRGRLEHLLINGEAAMLFGIARQLLVGNPDNLEYRLPHFLASDLARRSQEAFFLLIFWIDRMVESGSLLLPLPPRTQKRLLGTVTAIAWFSVKPADCVSVLWKRLENLSADNLPKFFGQGVLKSCLKLNNRREMQLIPLPPVEVIQDTLERKTTKARGFLTATSSFWGNWEWYNNFAGNFGRKDERLNRWYSDSLKSWKPEEDGDTQDLFRNAFQELADRLWGKRELLLYAQRRWLMKWYGKYDPTALDQLEDTDRPWDVDHIHPQNYIYNRKVPISRLIRDWHGCIGNLRLWPMELNRADGKEPPCKKLTKIEEIEKGL
jgi:hypothetical protein